MRPSFRYRLRARQSLASIEDYQQAAMDALPNVARAFVEGGAGDERTLRANRRAFAQWTLRQRVLAGHVDIDLSTIIDGQQFDLPVVLSPAGMAGLVHWSGERAAAQAAERAGTRLTLSTAATYSLEEVAEATENDHWFQLYPWGGPPTSDSLTAQLLRRARDAGYRSLVVTVDVPVAGNRLREQRAGVSNPPTLTPGAMADAAIHPRWWYGLLRHRRMTMRNMAYNDGATGPAPPAAPLPHHIRPEVTWDELSAIRDLWDGPFIVKGVLEPTDALKAVDEIGATGVVVSNHGGRQLNRATASLDALPAIAAALAGRASVLVDGGIRCGEDAVIALALGADAVMIGRPYLYGLAVDGAEGVEAVLELLAAEIQRTLSCMGVATTNELGPDHVEHCGRGEPSA